MKLDCPHCGHRLHIRTSRKVSLTLREAYWQCVNIECGHTCCSFTEIVRTLNQSQAPNPKVYVPLGKTKLTPQDPRQMDLLETTG